MSDLYEKENYLIEDRYVHGTITEYDIQAANINILFKAGIIDINYYNFLSSLPKNDREKEIGLLHLKLLPDIDVSKTISNELIKYRKMLFESNNLQDNEIVRIAKDAVFVLRSYNLNNLVFNDIVFRPKMVASAMININKILVFCWFNELDQIEIDTVGLGKNEVFHQNGMLTFIANVMYMVEKVSIKDAILYTQSIYKDYVERKLPIDYYREFNSDACFSIDNTYFRTMFYNGDINNIDINYNLHYIQEVYSILLNLYSQQKI